MFERRWYSRKFEVLVVLRPLRERLVSPTKRRGQKQPNYGRILGGKGPKHEN